MTICEVCLINVKTRKRTHGCGSLRREIFVCKHCYEKLHICFLEYKDCVKNFKEIEAEHIIPLLYTDEELEEISRIIQENRKKGIY